MYMGSCVYQLLFTSSIAYIVYMYVAIPWILNTVEGDRCVIGTLDWSKTKAEYKYVFQY